MKKLPDLYALISEHSGIPITANFPLIGENVFTHCAGVHTHAATKNPVHYQSVVPGLVGRKMDISLDHMSGISSVKWALEKIEQDITDDLAYKVLEKVKSVGQKGRTVGFKELPYIIEWCNENNRQYKINREN